MLGVRESVGGANGIECELEAKLWEESEKTKKNSSCCWTTNKGSETSESNNGDDDGRKQLFEKQQQPTSQRVEVVLGPLTVSTIIESNADDYCDNHNHEESQQQQQQQAHLTKQCEHISKYKFAPSTFYLGSNTSEPLPHKYKFKVYAPVVFQRIRTLFGVEKQTFLHSICGKFNLYEFASNAKSGQVSLLLLLLLLLFEGCLLGEGVN